MGKKIVTYLVWALFQFPPFKFNFEKLILRFNNAMKFGVVNKSSTANRFVLHTLQRNITHLAVITHKTNIKLGILKRGNWKRALVCNETSFSFQ